MQELLFPELGTYTSPFDHYDRIIHYKGVKDIYVVVFKRVDENDKAHYLVADRVKVQGEVPGVSQIQWLLTNAREFKHARDRAYRYYEKRVRELGQS